MPVSQGQVVNNRYRIAKQLAANEYGALYRAWDLNANGPCALQEVFETPALAQADVAAPVDQLLNLRHPNLARVIDAFDIPGQGRYLVMELATGDSLGELLEGAGGPLSEGRVLPWIYQVCDALNYLHSQAPPLAHCNISPATIYLAETPSAPQGQAVLRDLGFSRTSDPNQAAGAWAVSPGFSAPENYGRGTIDTRSDIYALGATLYTLLTGQRPAESNLIAGHDAPAPRPAGEINPQVSQNTSAAIERAMRINPAERFSSIQEFRNALSGVSQSSPYRPVTSPRLETLPPAMPEAAPDSTPATETAQVPELVPSTAVAQPPPQIASASPPAAGEPPRQRRWILIAGGIIMVLLVIVCGLVGGNWVVNYLDEQTETATPTVTATETEVVLTETLTPTPPEATDTPLPSPTEESGGGEIPNMVLIPAGQFQMGSPAGAADELPVHTVVLDAYYIDLYEVTNANYAACVDEGVCLPPSQSASLTRESYYGNYDFVDYPVIFVDWSMAQTYCEWRGGSLPTEAQWEKAARGDDMRTYPWGEGIDCTLANLWIDGSTCVRDTVMVGSYPSGISPYGLFDMAGNVWEWVLDWFDPGYYANSPAENPTGPPSGELRVLRGGSHGGGPIQQRTTTRGRQLPSKGYDYAGFRCVQAP